ncbi:large subunit ribosomal protein L4e [Enteropsectra breve]|nr:large subunit ribosomal protein L4e [Enteropsectra breve]
MSQKVNVYSTEGAVEKTVDRPDVFNMELRADLVQTVYALVRMNSRQPYAVSPTAGMQHSAESWGSGRAMARVPRVKGSGTRRAGQAAFANFARKGRMAHPTKVTRRWQRKTPKNLRRLVCAMSVAATANPAIVEGRGHRISQIEMLPIVVSDSINSITKTKEANELLTKLHLDEDLEKVRKSKTITCGKGKFRNRRYNKRKGLLIIHDNAELRAFKNIEGVEMLDVNSLDILALSPGGALGRLVMWTESAFMKLNSLFGTIGGSSEVKRGFSLPVPMVTSDDLGEYFYSSEIQSLINYPNMLPKGTCRKSDEELATTQEFIGLYNKLVQ